MLHLELEDLWGDIDVPMHLGFAQQRFDCEGILSVSSHGAALPPLEIQHQPFGFRAGHADLHDLVGRPLLVAENDVAMVGRA
jgi:hypothetical protein